MREDRLTVPAGEDGVRVLVLSDTHVPGRARDLPDAVWQAAEQAHLILHAGDVTAGWVLDALARFAPVFAVRGNLDGDELALPPARVVEVGGVRIGLVHGHEGTGHTTAERALATFRGRRVDAVVYGHSHLPHAERTPEGVWLVNPGSPTDPRGAPAPSFAWLRWIHGGIQVEHVPLPRS